MKAIKMAAFGGPDVLRLEDVPVPAAGLNEVRMNIRAAGVNPTDEKIRAGDLAKKIPLSLPWTPGYDFAGVTEDGAEVFGKTDPPGQGSYAEFVTVKKSSIAPKPQSIGYVHAAALPLPGLTAWQCLFGIGAARGLDLMSGATLLILGGAGGVGNLATQLAVWKGIRVVALVRRNQEFAVRNLGAETIFDLARAGDFDGVLDLVGGDLAARALANVKPGGVFASTLGFPAEADASAGRVRLVEVTTKTDADQLEELGRLLENETIHVSVARTFPLASAAAAHKELAKGVDGKLVLEV
jgi:NADPH:quinone reductase-like Zn-dependent oxidoreductase